MSIFLLTPKEQTAEEQPGVGTNTGEAVNQPAPPAPPAPAEGDVPDAAFVAPKQIDGNKIVLDGPLSQVYTEALNQMYARESYITELVTIEKVKQQQEAKELSADDDDYMYVVDGPYLESDGYVEAYNTLTVATERFKNVFVCVEHNLNITDRVAGFLEYATGLGCNVLSTRTRALEMMKSHLSGV